MRLVGIPNPIFIMAKDTFYFSHDYNSRNDEKIKFLLRKYGLVGYGLFWAIIEDLYNNANALRTDYDGIAYDFRIDAEVVRGVINDFDLFVFEGDTFGSLSVQSRMDARDSKSIKARESAHKRWNNANAMPTQCDSNAIKERKVKEIKESKVNNKESFIIIIEEHKDLLGDSYNDFLEYWTEPNKNGKLRYELEKFFDAKRRINTWIKNKNTYGNSKTFSPTAASEQRMATLKDWVNS